MTQPLATQQRVGSFILIEKIGSGGIGEVWKARDRRLNRVVALKFIRTDATKSPGDTAREARAAAALNHPSIVTILEIGDSAGGTYIAMEYVEGETLRARMDKARPPLEASLDIAVQTASGLAVAHKNGIVHGDVKPENVMLRIDGYVKLVDFGLARILPWSESALAGGTTELSHSGYLAGTLSYMSPEQARGRPLSAASDIFSCGIVFYELLTGENPFRADNPVDTLHRIINFDPVATRVRCPELPREIHDIVARCLKKDPAQRFQSAEDLEAHLRLARHAPHVGPRPRWRTAGAGVSLAILLGLSIWFWNPNVSQRGVPPVHSVAVLTFRTAPQDAIAGFLTESLSEDLGGALAREGFKVIPRSRVLGLGNTTDAHTVGDQLDVDAVVEGSVMNASEDNVRIHVELVDANTGFQIWEQSFTARSADLLSRQFTAELARQLHNAASGRQ